MARIETAMVVALALFATALPVGAHLAGHLFGLGLCLMLAVLVANFAAPAIPTVLVAAYLFQNLFVSLITPWVADLADFDSARAYNFLLTVTVWFVVMAHYVQSRASFDPAVRRLVNIASGVLLLVLAYFALGAVSAPKQAAVYLRNIATPFLLLQLCIVVAARFGRGVARPLAALGWLLLLYGHVELFLREGLFDLINANDYLEMRLRQVNDTGQWVKLMQETGLVTRDVHDTQKITLLNTPLLGTSIELYRLLGPNFHAISYAYGLAFFCLAFLAGGRIMYMLFALPLLVVVGSKGALILVLLTTLFVTVSRIAPVNALLWIFAAVLAAYAAATFVIGKKVGDYHVIGLLGGIDGFLHNPAGRGLGAGGNLSINMATIDWSRSQALGKTDTALESAIGVLLYQMGIAALAVCAANVCIALAAWRQFLATRRSEFAVVAFALLAVTTNGLFQEEALFAPLAVGTLMMLAGLVLGATSVADRHPSPVVARTAKPVGVRP
ncbi:MAG: hypothetical protein K0S06_2901 [Microvirga sp.]|jgi:hypothetical protein|nr:hypothetical protein [Microvirga sp.]